MQPRPSNTTQCLLHSLSLSLFPSLLNSGCHHSAFGLIIALASCVRPASGPAIGGDDNITQFAWTDRMARQSIGAREGDKKCRKGTGCQSISLSRVIATPFRQTPLALKQVDFYTLCTNSAAYAIRPSVLPVYHVDPMARLF